jgi:hypothetical protein
LPAYSLTPTPGLQPDTILSWDVHGPDGFLHEFWTADYPHPDTCYRDARLYCDALNVVYSVENKDA